jgi:hypothetical protein
MPEDPQTLAERREAVDAAHVLLLIASGRTYSLMTTTLDINEARCEAILRAGRARSVEPNSIRLFASLEEDR